MSLTSTFSTQAGDVTVTVGVSATGTFDVIEIGKIEYDFDLTNYGDAVNKVGVLYNRSQMTVYRYTTGGEDFYDILYNHLYVTVIQPIPVTVSVALHSGGTAEFKFTIQKRSISRKINEQTMKVDLDPLVNPAVTVQDVTNATIAAYGFETIRTGGISSFGLLVGSFIQYVCSGLNSNLPTIVESAYQNTAGLSSVSYPVITGIADLVDGDSYLFVADGTADAELAIDAVKNYAVLEGGIFGTGFDQNFYVHRMRTDRNVVFYDNDLESCESELIPTPYRSISLTMDQYSSDPFNNISPETQSASTNVLSEKSVSGIFPMIGVGKGEWDSLNARMDTGAISLVDPEPVVVASGLLSHKTALNASSAPIFKAKMTVLGMDKFKPYQTITLSGETFPREFRFNPSSIRRYYRPTYISYDLYNDKVELKLYAIV